MYDVLSIALARNTYTSNMIRKRLLAFVALDICKNADNQNIQIILNSNDHFDIFVSIVAFFQCSVYNTYTIEKEYEILLIKSKSEQIVKYTLKI